MSITHSFNNRKNKKRTKKATNKFYEELTVPSGNDKETHLEWKLESFSE